MAKQSRKLNAFSLHFFHFFHHEREQVTADVKA
jgi:hypothetical protein